MSTEYRVVWEIELSASDPVDAARQARGVQLDPRCRATVFDVHGDSGRRQVDLDDVDG
jgi:hypothetical protein